MDDKEKKEIYREWRSLINMSQKALDDWAKDPRRLDASLNREEAGSIQSGYDSFHRIKRRKSKKFEDWSPQDFENAKQENGFNKRMLGNEPGKPISKENSMSKWEVSLRNWGHDPSLKSSPAYSKYQQWKKRMSKKASLIRPIVFLDLDETLIHAKEGDSKENVLEKKIKSLREAEKKLDAILDRESMKYKFQQKLIENYKSEVESLQTGTSFTLDGSSYALFKRKDLENFLKQLNRFSDVYIFSAGTKKYVGEVLKSLGAENLVKDYFSVRNKNIFSFVKDRPFILVDNLSYGSQGVQNKLKQILGDKRNPNEKDHYQITAFTGRDDGALSTLAFELEKSFSQEVVKTANSWIMKKVASKIEKDLQSPPRKKQACIIATGRKKGRDFLFKNRDRNYEPELKIYHTYLPGDVEVAYMKDEVTGWVEGINEFGIGIVNSALSVGRDEKEKKLVSIRNGKKFKDGQIILRALQERSLSDAVKIICEFEGGLRGHTFIRDKDEIYHIESMNQDDCKVKKLSANKSYARTNHGLNFESAGYTRGPAYISSQSRLEQMKRVLPMLDDFYDIPEKLYNKGEREGFRRNSMVRDVKMWTSSLMLLDITKLKLVLYLIPGKQKFLGYKDQTSVKRKNKIQVSVKEIVKKEEGGIDFETII